MRFGDGVVIGAASGLGASLFFGTLTELVIVAVLGVIVAWRLKWSRGRNTPSTEKKSPSSYL